MGYLNLVNIYENNKTNTAVFTATKDGKKVILKFTDKEDGLKEKAIIEQLQPHRHIIKILDCLEVDEKTVCLVFPFIDDQKQKLLGNIAHIRRFMLQLLKALAHMHAKGVVHCDLKPDNILFDGENVTVIDLGHSHTLKDLSRAEVGTGSYSPLELHILQRSDYSPVIDVWSTAVMLCELLVGQRLFAGEDDEDRFAKIDAFVETMEENQLFEFPDKLAVKIDNREKVSLISLLDGMFQRRPQERYTAEICLRAPWVTRFCIPNDDTGKDNAVVPPTTIATDKEAVTTTTTFLPITVTVATISDPVARLSTPNTEMDSKSDSHSCEDRSRSGSNNSLGFDRDHICDTQSETTSSFSGRSDDSHPITPVSPTDEFCFHDIPWF